MPNPLDAILGLGYSGYATIDGVGLLLHSASPPAESDNLIKSQGTVGDVPDLAAGELVARNRRSLEFTLTSDLCPAVLELGLQTVLAWRQANQFSNAHAVVVIPANGEGYVAPEVYIHDVSITVPRDGLATITFRCTAWHWTEILSTGVTPAIQGAFPVFAVPAYQPIPFWDVAVTHSGQVGVPQELGVDFRNGWQFRQLLEGTPGPPTPRLIYPGPLISTLRLVTLAQRNQRPAESGTATIVFGGGRPGNTTCAATTLTLPFLYRDPQRTYEGFGQPNVPVYWSVVWSTFGTVPSAA
jgi:hypothetical protein